MFTRVLDVPSKQNISEKLGTSIDENLDFAQIFNAKSEVVTDLCDLLMQAFRLMGEPLMPGSGLDDDNLTEVQRAYGFDFYNANIPRSRSASQEKMSLRASLVSWILRDVIALWYTRDQSNTSGQQARSIIDGLVDEAILAEILFDATNSRLAAEVDTYRDAARQEFLVNYPARVQHYNEEQAAQALKIQKRKEREQAAAARQAAKLRGKDGVESAFQKLGTNLNDILRGMSDAVPGDLRLEAEKAIAAAKALEQSLSQQQGEVSSPVNGLGDAQDSQKDDTDMINGNSGVASQNENAKAAHQGGTASTSKATAADASKGTSDPGPAQQQIATPSAPPSRVPRSGDVAPNQPGLAPPLSAGQTAPANQATSTGRVTPPNQMGPSGLLPQNGDTDMTDVHDKSNRTQTGQTAIKDSGAHDAGSGASKSGPLQDGTKVPRVKPAKLKKSSGPRPLSAVFGALGRGVGLLPPRDPPSTGTPSTGGVVSPPRQTPSAGVFTNMEFRPSPRRTRPLESPTHHSPRPSPAERQSAQRDGSPPAPAQTATPTPGARSTRRRGSQLGGSTGPRRSGRTRKPPPSFNFDGTSDQNQPDTPMQDPAQDDAVPATVVRRPDFTQTPGQPDFTQTPGQPDFTETLGQPSLAPDDRSGNIFVRARKSFRRKNPKGVDGKTHIGDVFPGLTSLKRTLSMDLLRNPVKTSTDSSRPSSTDPPPGQDSRTASRTTLNQTVRNNFGVTARTGGGLGIGGFVPPPMPQVTHVDAPGVITGPANQRVVQPIPQVHVTADESGEQEDEQNEQNDKMEE